MSNAQWFYADGGGTQQGPVDAAFLREATRRGELGLDSVVWRDGLGGWRPLRQVADELGLAHIQAMPPHVHPDANRALAGVWEGVVRKHPWYGIASCAIGVIAGFLMLVLLILSGAASMSHDLNQGSLGAVLVTFWYDSLNVLDGVAIGFGIVGLVQKDRSKVSSIIGIVIASITVIVNMAP